MIAAGCSPGTQLSRRDSMLLPAMVAVSASVPYFATLISEGRKSESDDLLTVLYLCGAGLLFSLAALLDDSINLTSWFGLNLVEP
jgi:hypothetical protein